MSAKWSPCPSLFRLLLLLLFVGVAYGAKSKSTTDVCRPKKLLAPANKKTAIAKHTFGKLDIGETLTIFFSERRKAVDFRLVFHYSNQSKAFDLVILRSSTIVNVFFRTYHMKKKKPTTTDHTKVPPSQMRLSEVVDAVFRLDVTRSNKQSLMMSLYANKMRGKSDYVFMFASGKLSGRSLDKMTNLVNTFSNNTQLYHMVKTKNAKEMKCACINRRLWEPIWEDGKKTKSGRHLMKVRNICEDIAFCYEMETGKVRKYLTSCRKKWQVKSSNMYDFTANKGMKCMLQKIASTTSPTTNDATSENVVANNTDSPIPRSTTLSSSTDGGMISLPIFIVVLAVCILLSVGLTLLVVRLLRARAGGDTKEKGEEEKKKPNKFTSGKFTASEIDEDWSKVAPLSDNPTQQQNVALVTQAEPLVASAIVTQAPPLTAVSPQITVPPTLQHAIDAASPNVISEPVVTGGDLYENM